MTHYRIYLLDKADHFLAAQNVTYETDQEAFVYAAGLIGNHSGVEIWDYTPHPSPHFVAATAGTNAPAFDTASANFSISGRRRCSGMLGMSS